MDNALLQALGIEIPPGGDVPLTTRNAPRGFSRYGYTNPNPAQAAFPELAPADADAMYRRMGAVPAATPAAAPQRTGSSPIPAIEAINRALQGR